MSNHHSGRNWTNSEDTIIRQAWLDGTQVILIAEQLGATRNAIISRAGRIGCGQHPSADRSRDEPKESMAWKPRIAFQGRRFGWEKGNA